MTKDRNDKLEECQTEECKKRRASKMAVYSALGIMLFQNALPLTSVYAEGNTEPGTEEVGEGFEFEGEIPEPVMEEGVFEEESEEESEDDSEEQETEEPAGGSGEGDQAGDNGDDNGDLDEGSGEEGEAPIQRSRANNAGDLARAAAGPFTISDNAISDSDYVLDSTAKTLTITATDNTKAITIKNTNPAVAADYQIIIAATANANLILDGINLEISKDNAGAIEVLAGGKAAMTLAANSQNLVRNTASGHVFLNVNSAADSLVLTGTGSLVAEALGAAGIAYSGSGTIQTGNYQFSGSYGIRLVSGRNLRIEGGDIQVNGTGSAISGGTDASAKGNLTIAGGTIRAKGDNTAGDNGYGITYATITGGELTVEAVRWGINNSQISGGELQVVTTSGYATISSSTISGGSIKAENTSGGQAVSNANITGGIVETKATTNDYAAINTGTISGGTVTAENKGTANDISYTTITGGSVKAVNGKVHNSVTPANHQFAQLIDYTVPAEGIEVKIDDAATGFPVPANHPNGNGLSFFLEKGKDHTVVIKDLATQAKKTYRLIWKAASGSTTEGDWQLFRTLEVTGEGIVEGTDYIFDDDAKTLTINSDKAMTIKNTDAATAADYQILIPENKTANLTFDGVNIEVDKDSAGAVRVLSGGKANVTLADGSQNVIKNTSATGASIQNSDSDGTADSFIIRGSGDLKLEAGSSAYFGYGTIKSGNIQISGAYGIEAIKTGEFHIEGGNVHVTSTSDSATINKATIKGGTVTAENTGNGPDIGDTEITSGSVKAVNGRINGLTPANHQFSQLIEYAVPAEGIEVKIDGGTAFSVPANHTNADGTKIDDKLSLFLQKGKDHTVVIKDLATQEEKTYRLIWKWGSGSTTTGDWQLSQAAERNLEVTGADVVENTDYTFDDDAKTLTINSDKAMTIQNADFESAADYQIIIAATANANLTLDGINLEVSKANVGAIEVLAGGKTAVTLAANSQNLVKNTNGNGILNTNGSMDSLVWAGSGSLAVEAKGSAYFGSGTIQTGNYQFLGQYGIQLGSNRNLRIEGGDIQAYGTATAISGGTSDATKGNLTIADGKIRAKGENTAGTGGYGITRATITGGELTVEAVQIGINNSQISAGELQVVTTSRYVTIENSTISGGGIKAENIGGGVAVGSTDITNGVVEAKANTNDRNAVSVGTISGGTVTAENKGTAYDISGTTINGGSVKAVNGKVNNSVKPADHQFTQLIDHTVPAEGIEVKVDGAATGFPVPANHPDGNGLSFFLEKGNNHTVVIKDKDAAGKETTYDLIWDSSLGTGGDWRFAAAPVITTADLPDGTAGEAYDQTLAATGDGTITWKLAPNSTLPDGLSLAADTGKITGTPTTASDYSFSVIATANELDSEPKALTLTVAAAVDKSALQDLVDDAEALAPSDYTPSTWADVDAAVKTAKGVLADDDATQDEVDDALDALQTAIDALKESTDISDEDKAAINGALTIPAASEYDGQTRTVTVDENQLPAKYKGKVILSYEKGGVTYDEPQKNAGTYNLIINVTGKDGFISGKGQLVIRQRTVITRDITVPAREYDGTVSVPKFNMEILNILEGDEVESKITNAAYADKNVGKDKEIDYTATLSGKDVGNYRINEQPTARGQILPRTLTLDFAVSDKVYDGTTNTGEFYLTDDNIIEGDDINFIPHSEFMDKNVGENKEVVYSLDLTGDDVANYALPNELPELTGNITQRELTMQNVTAVGRPVDGTLTVDLTGGQMVHVVLGDENNIGFTLGEGTIADEAAKTTAGTYDVTTNIQLTGSEKGNYTLTQPTGLTATLTAVIDKSVLQGKIDTAEGLKEADYTSESWAGSKIEQVIETAKAVLGDADASQDEVDEAVEALDEAMSKLVYQAKADLDDLIKDVDDNYKEDDYTPDSWNRLQDVLEEVKDVANDPASTPNELAEAEKNLQDAIDDLVEKGDTTHLQELIDEAGQLKEEDYTPDSWSILAEAKKEAEDLITKGGGSEQEVKAAEDKLQAALDDLVYQAKSDLDDLIKDVDDNYKEDDYTPDSWNHLQEILEDSKQVANNPASTPDELAEAEKNLQDAIDDLVEKGDTAHLQELINEADQLQEADYTPDSWSTLAEAKKEAEDLIAKGGGSEQEVKAAEDKLQSAIDGLEPVQKGLTDKEKVAINRAITLPRTSQYDGRGKGANLNERKLPAEFKGKISFLYEKDGQRTAEKPVNAGDYTVIVVVEGRGEYVYDKGTIKITPRKLGLYLTARDKTYDGNTSVRISQRVTNIVRGDDVSVAIQNAQFKDKNAGRNKGVTYSVELTGADKDNYVVGTQPKLKADIKQKALKQSDLSYKAEDKKYDGKRDATVTTQIKSGLIDGDQIQLKAENPMFNNADPGNRKPVSISRWTLTGKDAKNYSLPKLPSTLYASITGEKPQPGKQKLSIPQRYIKLHGKDKRYDGNRNAQVDVTVTGNKLPRNVQLVAVDAQFDNANVGKNKTITVRKWKLVGKDAHKYELQNIGTMYTKADITKKSGGQHPGHGHHPWWHPGHWWGH